MDSLLYDKLHKEYYKPGRYFKPSKYAANKLAKLANTTENQAHEFLMRQPIYQIYLSAPRTIERPNDSFSDYLSINAIHEADVLYLPHDNGHKYVLAVVDVATRYKIAVPLTNKTSKTVADAFETIYDNGDNPLKPPIQLSVGKGKEFFKDVTSYFKSKDTNIYRSHELTHIVERFNETLAQHLFRIQYHKEMQTGKTNREWVNDLPQVLKAINDTKTRLITDANGNKISPNEAIKIKGPIRQLRSLPSFSSYSYFDDVIKIDDTVRYLLKDGELYNDKKRRATDPIWSVDLYIVRNIRDLLKPVYYYLEGINDRHFLRKELQLVKYIANVR